MASRNYLKKTIKILFARSGNQCAHPECSVALVEEATALSGDEVIGEISHIYPHSDTGPRAQPNSDSIPDDTNDPENLILLCPNHHKSIDKQPETYSLGQLKKWKQDHEAKIFALVSGEVDQKIHQELDLFRKSRRFPQFNRIQFSQKFAKKLFDGEFQGGSNKAKGLAFAWCARVLSTEDIEEAKKYMEKAKTLKDGDDIKIAEAFLVSREGDEDSALKMLGTINTTASRSASLMVVTHRRDTKNALEWFEDSDFSISDMDPSGKSFLLLLQLDCGHWEKAVQTVEALDDMDFEEEPFLHQLTAYTFLAKAVPDDLRSKILSEIPFEVFNFPLNDTADGIKDRKLARLHFSKASLIAKQFGFIDKAILNDVYALWLGLSDPETYDMDRKQLEKVLQGPDISLRHVWLGIEFNIGLNIESVEQEIERQKLRNGNIITPDGAFARLALACAKKTPQDVVSYVEQHYADLSTHFDKKLFLSFQIEMFSRAGMFDKANECLDSIIEGGLSNIEKDRLMAFILEASRKNPLAEQRKRYEDTEELVDLHLLVEELERLGNWQELYKYAEKLFEKTNTVHEAERFSNVLTRIQKFDELIVFLESHPDLLPQSKNLQMSYAWALYHEGKLLQSHAELTKISDISDDPSYRQLLVNLEIVMGNWNSLFEYVRKELANKHNRSVDDLMGTTQLAFHINSPDAKELLFAVAEMGNDDANILASAYWLASTAGLDDDPSITKWLFKAAELSGDHGPIQTVTLEDLAGRKPEWDRYESNAWQVLGRGDVPMFIASKALNGTLVNLMLFSAYANLSERDPRHRGAIPAYSGKRHPLTLDITKKTVGIDATALLTLGFLDLLDKALDAFDATYVPHSTLIWLLEEKKKVAFHQPSRIRDADKLRNMLVTDILKKFVPSTVADRELSTQVGDDLAMLITEAKKRRDEDKGQRIVVRPSPVHRIGSLMDEEADLTEHTDVISSCLAVVEKLKQKGRLTLDEENKAHAYLQIHEKIWQRQPVISDGAMLYLDDLAVDYFLHLGILDKLGAAGFTVFVSPNKIYESNHLISYDSNAEKVIETMEYIRTTLKSRIKLGQLKVGKRHVVDRSDGHPITDHPTTDVFALAEVCDVVIIDDRFINQHEDIGEADVKATILSTLDLLDVLVSADTGERMKYRTRLRQAGYFFIPVCEDELNQHLNACLVADGKFNETAELKAIRENLLRVRMSDWLQLPKEAPWLDTTIKALIAALKRLWVSGADPSKVEDISNWIVDQIDIRGWAHRLDDEIADDIVKTGRGSYILSMLMFPVDSPNDTRKAYWKWLESRVLTEIKEQFPELYDWILEHLKQQVSNLVDIWENRNDE